MGDVHEDESGRTHYLPWAEGTFTRKGRVVYRRAPHFWTWKAILRTVRDLPSAYDLVGVGYPYEAMWPDYAPDSVEGQELRALWEVYLEIAKKLPSRDTEHRILSPADSVWHDIADWVDETLTGIWEEMRERVDLTELRTFVQRIIKRLTE